MSDDELKKAINKHFTFKNCACCGYSMTKAEQEAGNVFCFDCVNESHSQTIINPFDFNTDNGVYDDESE